MIIFVRSFCIFYLVLQCDATGIMRRLLKFPPVEDVRILIRMAISYKERIFTGKGVTVPQQVHEFYEDDPLKVKNEPKNPVLLTTSNKEKNSYSDRIENIINLLQYQTVQYFIYRNEYNNEKMASAYEQLSTLREEISKLPRKIRYD